MTVLNSNGMLYGRDGSDQRWSVPVASVACVYEQTANQSGVFLYVNNANTFVQAGMADDTMESVYQAVYGTPLPSNVP